MAPKTSNAKRRSRSSNVDTNDRLAFLAEIAAFYYDDRLTQEQISQQIGLSDAMVSRLLAEAHDKGVVEVRIRYPVTGVVELQTALMQRFNLRTVRVLAGRNEAEDRQLQRVGALAARYLRTVLADNSVITIGWGRTLYHVVQAITGTARHGIRVVQMLGALGTSLPQIDNHELTRALAEQLHGDPYYLHAPMIVESPEVRRALLQDPNLSRSLEMARKADIMLLGIGVPDPAFSGLRQAGYVAAETLQDIRDKGCVGDICVNYFDIYGRRCPLDLDDRVVGLRIEDLKNARHAIVVGIGAYKAAAILGAIRTGYPQVLVTDAATAEEVLRLTDEFPLDSAPLSQSATQHTDT